MVVLDTDILVAFLRDHEDAINKIKQLYNREVPVFTTPFTIFELFKGAHAMHDPGKKIEEVELLLGEIDVLFFDAKTSKIAGKIYDSLKKEGKLIDIIDQFIASVAIANNETVITRNTKDFSKVQGLKVEKW